MRHWNAPSISDRGAGQTGRASIEFLVVAILVFVPLVFVIQILWSLQGASIAAEQASRDAARVFITHTSLPAATRASENIARQVMNQHGITGPVRIQRSCRPAQCLSPGAVVGIRVTTDVTLWQVPVFRRAWPVTVPMSAMSTARVSSYGGR